MCRVIHLLAFVVCQCLSYSATAIETTTLSVLPFSAQKGEQQAWLGKGIADMLMRDLSEVDGLVILERHELQTFLNEMELTQTAFINQDHALRIGNVAKLEQVIFGNYTLNNNQIEINFMSVPFKT